MAAGSLENQDRLNPAQSAQLAGRAVPAQVKVLALIGFVCAVVATPAQQWWPYLGYLAVLAVVVAIADIPPAKLLRGLAVEVPFVAFALALPLLASGPRVTIVGLSLSVAGLWGAATLLAKSTLSVIAALVLAATTAPEQLVFGLQRLRVPAVLVEILGFMIRYLTVITQQWQRMAMAREARGFQTRSPRAWMALSGAVGSGFVRAFERGERVQVAMLSRGYTGALPDAWDTAPRASNRSWAGAALVVAAAWSITATAWWLA